MSDEPTAIAYAGLGRRLLAALLDNAVWFFGLILFAAPAIGALYEESPEAAWVLLVVFASAWFNYFGVCEWRWGQTIGKNATGIEVRPVDGEPLTFAAASMRNVLRIVDFLVVGWVMIAADRRDQRLGDKLAKTVVVRRTHAAGRDVPAATAAHAVVPGAVVPGAAVPAAAAPGPAAVVPMASGPPPASSDAARTVVPGAEGGPPPADGGVPPAPSGEDAGPEEGPASVPWSLGDAGKGIGIAFAIGVIVAPLLILPFDPDLSSDGALLVAQGMLGAALIGTAMAVATGWRLRPVSLGLGNLGLRRFAPSALGWMLLAMFGYYVIAGLFASLVVQPEQEDIGGELGVGDENLLIAISAVAMIAVVAPVSEELFFRGMVYPGFRNRFGVAPAAILAGLIFGLIHAPTGITTVVPLGILGVILCLLYEKTGSLWPCVIAHAINNSLALLLVS